MERPYFIALKGVPWDRERSEAFVQMFAEMGVRAIAGHKDDRVIFTIYDQQAAQQFVEEMQAAGIDASVASSTDEFLNRARDL